MKKLTVGSVVLAAWTLVACGGKSDDGGGVSGDDCSTFQACGGDPVGEWVSTGACIDLEALVRASVDEPECQDIFKDISATMRTTLSIGADGTYAESGTLEMSLMVSFHDACARAQGGSGVTPSLCAARESAYVSSGNYSAASCQMAAGNCDCTVETVPETTSTSGTYVVNDNEITVTEPGEPAWKAVFCVSGDTLKVRAASSDGVVIGVISYRRQ